MADIPDGNNYFSGNFYLSRDQMRTNVAFALKYFKKIGWTDNAIAGALGNMEYESTINPGIWQDLKPNRGGYGLTQWTPYTKYTTWCEQNKLDKSRMETAIERLDWELKNNQQWVTHKAYPMTFKEFIVSKDPPYNLAMTFLHNYEMPKDLNQPKRGTAAEYWYSYITGGLIPDVPIPDNPPEWVAIKGNSSIIPIICSKYRRR